VPVCASCSESGARCKNRAFLWHYSGSFWPSIAFSTTSRLPAGLAVAVRLLLHGLQDDLRSRVTQAGPGVPASCLVTFHQLVGGAEEAAKPHRGAAGALDGQPGRGEVSDLGRARQRASSASRGARLLAFWAGKWAESRPYVLDSRVYNAAVLAIRQGEVLLWLRIRGRVRFATDPPP